MPNVNCPTTDLLEAYSVGKLDRPDSEFIERHIETCDNCDETLSSLENKADPLIALLRSQAGPVPALPDNYSRVLSFVKQIGGTPDFPSGAVAAQPLAGEPLGELRDYRLLAKLGEGGMGAVYQALHTRLDKIVALKILPGDKMRDAGAVARFQREMKAVGRLAHPHIVMAHDAGEVDGTHFLVMEYVDGDDLSALIRRSGPLPIADACEIIRQAALGLQVAWENGLIHRDLKPSNLMITRAANNQPSTVKILDLGLAIIDEQTGDEELTSTGQVMGTLDYMSPEQARDSHEVDIRADIYALGATLFKLLSGQAPFGGRRYQKPAAKLHAILNESPPPIQKLRSDVPEELEAILKRLLAQNPDDRPSTPAELAGLMAPFVSGADLSMLPLPDGTSVPSVVDQSLTGTSPKHSSADQDTEPAIPQDYRGESRAAAAPSHSANLSVDSPTLAAAVGSARGRSHTTRPLRSRVVLMLVALGLGGLAVFLASTLFFVQTPEGVVRVEVNDPSIEVAIKGTEIVIKEKEQETIRLRPGKHALVVERDGFEFETDELTLRNGETVTLEVKLLPGKMQVVQGNQVIGERRLPEEPDPKDADQTPEEQLASGDDTEVQPAVADGKSSDLTSQSTSQAGTSPLNDLDPSLIPESERFDWQPPGLVAVAGEHRGGHGNGHFYGIGGVQHVEFSPDGNYALSNSGAVLLWDAQEMKEVGSFGIMHRTVRAAFLGDSSHLLISSVDVNKNWDRQRIMRRNEQGNIVLVKHMVHDGNPAPDGKHLVGNKDGMLCLIDVENNEVARIYERTADQGSWFHFGNFSADSKYFVSYRNGGSDALLLNLETGEVVYRFKGRADFCPKGDDLIIVNNGIRRIRWRKDEVAWEAAHGNVQDVRVARHVERACLQVGNGNCKIIDTTNGEVIKELAVGAATADISPDGSRLVTADRHHVRAVRMWDVDSGEEINPSSGHMAALLNVGFLGDGGNMVTNGGDNRLLRWDLTGTAPQIAQAVDYGRSNTLMPKMGISHDSKRVVLAPYGDSLTVFFERGNGLEFEREFKCPGLSQWSTFIWAPHRPLLLSGLGNGSGLRFVNFEQVPATLHKVIETEWSTSAQFIANRDVLLLYSGGSLRVMDYSDLDELTEVQSFKPHNGQPFGVSVSSDGTLVASAAYEQNYLCIRLWEVSDDGLKEQAQWSEDPDAALLGSNKATPSIELSPDASQVLTHEPSGGPTRLWDVASRQQLADWTPPPHYSGLRFVPDGEHLWYRSRLGQVGIVRIAQFLAEQGD